MNRLSILHRLPPVHLAVIVALVLPAVSCRLAGRDAAENTPSREELLADAGWLNPALMALDDPATSQSLTSPTLRIRPRPAPLPPASNVETLRQRLEEVLETAFDPSRVYVHVQDATSPLVILDHQGADRISPGNLQTLVTTAAALHRLGPDFRYRTIARVNGPKVGDRIEGDLLIEGSGDPSLGRSLVMDPEADFGALADQAFGTFRQWARDLRELGVRKIAGSVISDTRAFEGSPEGPDWPQELRGSWKATEVTALNFHENCIHVFLEGGRKPRRPTDSDVFPSSLHVLLHNTALTGYPDDQPEIFFQRPTGSDVVRVMGTVPPRMLYVDHASVHDAPRHFLLLMRAVFEDEGVFITQGTRDLSELLRPEEATTGTWPVAVHVSPPLSELVRDCNSRGQSFYAECLLKTMGRRLRDTATFEAGSQVVQQFLTEQGLRATDVDLVDGSGLSRRDVLTPIFLNRVLRSMQEGPLAETYLASLPRPGDFGVLGDRFETARQLDPEAAARIRATCGSLHGFVTMGGYVDSAAGARFAVTMAVNDARLKEPEAWDLLENLAMTLATSRVRLGAP